VHFRGGNAAVTAHAYDDVDESGTIPLRRSARSLLRSPPPGCTYVQIDETAFAKFDPEVQASLRRAATTGRR
jgi:5-methyltetrahydropteroyltriglutamate--homocysteine methyltransferase